MQTQKQIRRSFWEKFPRLDEQARKRGTRSKPQNAQTTDCRVTFCDYVESLRRTGAITPQLANRATL